MFLYRLSRWYNIPVDPPSSKKTNGVQPNNGSLGAETSPSTATKDQDTELDSRPLNFETFVPTHDPSLATDPAPNTNYVAESEEGHMVTQDEAFSRAVSAMYWGGYWTAMYQVWHPSQFVAFENSHLASVNGRFTAAQKQIV